MEILTKAIPSFLFKLVVVIMGGILSLLLSGDISTDDKNRLVLNHIYIICIKLISAIVLGLVIGEFIIDYWHFEHLSFYAQSIFNLLVSVFGIMIIGMLYRAYQLTFTDKTVAEIIIEIKNILRAFRG